VFGGYTHEEDPGHLWMFHCDSVVIGTASWELIAPTSELNPTARMLATLSRAHPVGLILFGGGDDESFLNNVWLFDTRSAVWTMFLPYTAQAANASVRPDGRVGHSAITHKSSSEVVIFGGAREASFLIDVLSLSSSTYQ